MEFLSIKTTFRLLLLPLLLLLVLLQHFRSAKINIADGYTLHFFIVVLQCSSPGPRYRGIPALACRIPRNYTKEHQAHIWIYTNARYFPSSIFCTQTMQFAEQLNIISGEFKPSYHIHAFAADSLRLKKMSVAKRNLRGYVLGHFRTYDFLRIYDRIPKTHLRCTYD